MRLRQTMMDSEQACYFSLIRQPFVLWQRSKRMQIVNSLIIYLIVSNLSSNPTSPTKLPSISSQVSKQQSRQNVREFASRDLSICLTEQHLSRISIENFCIMWMRSRCCSSSSTGEWQQKWRCPRDHSDHYSSLTFLAIIKTTTIFASV